MEMFLYFLFYVEYITDVHGDGPGQVLWGSGDWTLHHHNERGKTDLLRARAIHSNTTHRTSKQGEIN